MPEETLQQLAQRRMAELGGVTGPLSMRQVHLRGGGDEEWSYESVRRIVKLGYSGVTDRVIDRLALALDLPVTTVEAAAKIKPRLGRFQLPRTADRLDSSQRQVVQSVVDALLSAMGRSANNPDEPDDEHVSSISVTNVEPNGMTGDPYAAAREVIESDQDLAPGQRDRLLQQLRTRFEVTD